MSDEGPSILEVYLERMRIAEADHQERWDSLTPDEKRRERASMVGLFTPVIEPMPIRMEFGPVKREPFDFILNTRLGGFDVRRRPSTFLIVTDIAPIPRHYHTDSTRKQKRARCKARRRARLPRRHWVRRARRGER